MPTLTIKSTTTLEVPVGYVGLVAELVERQNDGSSLTDNFSIYDIASPNQTVDEVTVKE